MPYPFLDNCGHYIGHGNKPYCELTDLPECDADSCPNYNPEPPEIYTPPHDPEDFVPSYKKRRQYASSDEWKDVNNDG